MLFDGLNRIETIRAYEEFVKLTTTKAQRKDALRKAFRENLYLLLVIACGRVDFYRQGPTDAFLPSKADWLFDRCVEVQKNPNGYIDLWSREFFKSSIITFGKILQDILINPNETVGILSHTRPIAKGFQSQLKREMEENKLLKTTFDDILYWDPKKESPKWSDDEGLIVKRTSNPAVGTIEAYGLVDGQPTAKHWSIVNYDDVVTRESVTTPDMIRKTTEAWELSLNLGTAGGAKRYVGTRYHYNDTYSVIIERKAAIPRIYPATKDGTWEGEPVLWTKNLLDRKRKEMGGTAAAQLLLNPKGDSSYGLQREWLKTWDAKQFKNLSIAILVDPADSKDKEATFAVFTVVGIGADQNYYVITWVRDRLNLIERADTLFTLHRQYFPGFVGYEKYSMQADIQHIKYQQDRENYRFDITPLGGNIAKPERIEGLGSKAQGGRLYIPETCPRMNREGVVEDLTRIFIDEWCSYPFGAYVDMLDCLARVSDIPTHTLHIPGANRNYQAKQVVRVNYPYA